MIVGIDEVGRGAWAGPLVVGAVLLGDAKIEGLTDSKKLTKKRREQLDIEIRKQAKAIGLGWVSAKQIDQIGLSEALKLASRRAIAHIKHDYTEIIIDGTIRLIDDGRVTLMKKADLLIPSVSAASIIAKVARDNYMRRCDQVFPGYRFTGHVGYGTAVHRAAIEELGVTPLHRLSFAPLSKYTTVVASSPTKSSKTASRPMSVEYASESNGAADVFEHLSDERLDAAKAHAGGVRRGRPKNPFAKGKKFLGADRTAGPASHDLRGTVSSSDDGSGQDGAKTTKQIGNAGEDAAARYLWQQGHNIIDRNWRTKFCEIDIISQFGDTIYFTEVKYRKNDKQGGGLAAITPKKQRQMKFAAEFYSAKEQLTDIDLRLAVVDVTGEPPQVRMFLALE